MLSCHIMGSKMNDLEILKPIIHFPTALVLWYKHKEKQTVYNHHSNIFPCFVWMCMCLYMSVHTCGLTVWVYACGGQSLMLGVSLDHSPSYSSRHDLSVKQKTFPYS